MDNLKVIKIVKGVRGGNIVHHIIFTEPVSSDDIDNAVSDWCEEDVNGHTYGYTYDWYYVDDSDEIGRVIKYELERIDRGINSLVNRRNDLAPHLKREPYMSTTTINTEYQYNRIYGDDRICKCGHPYYRHFDTYEDMEAVGCKYCFCGEFEEANTHV
jgi:hypothetical protein